MASFHDFALVCQALGQIGSRTQMAELAGELLARLDPDEAAIAARFMAGQALAQGEEKRLQVSGRAIWRIVAAITGGEDQGEEIFAATADFGEAIEMLLRTRPLDPEPALTLAGVNRGFAEIAEIEGRGARRRKLDALRELFECASALEGKYLAKILIREMRHGISESLMLEAIARMAGRPVAEVRRAFMLEADLGRVVLMLRSPAAPSTAAARPTPHHGARQPAAMRAAAPAAAPGVAAKALASPGTADASGRAWNKIKNARTLNLVIVAADWGRGRRHGLLSNYHLAARDERRGKFVEIGKTFKGLTGADFEEMTRRLLAIQTGEAEGTVTVRPEIVVEVVYSDIQRGPQYAGGMALRLARIAGVRSDKSAEEADTIATVAAAFEKQSLKPRTDSE